MARRITRGDRVRVATMPGRPLARVLAFDALDRPWVQIELDAQREQIWVRLENLRIETSQLPLPGFELRGPR